MIITRWTIQQFGVVAGQPWYALQRSSQDGAIWGTTGHKCELDELCHELNIVPVVLPPITEQKFHRGVAGDVSGDCHV